MGFWARSSLAFLFAAGVLTSTAGARQEASGDHSNTQLSEKEQKKRSDKALKELDQVYRKWLDEDVLYIITPDERKAFLQLATNEEREQFIEQFWLRRNPNPDDPDNSFKEEHYRRIAYANEHYSSGKPGWKTDRGRTYIMWGAPDEIDSHPMGGLWVRPMDQGGGETDTYPWEVWRYRHMEGVGDNVEIEFVDPSMTGEFHMTMDPGEKDALLHVANMGRTELEQLGLANKTDRVSRTDGTTMGSSLYDTGQEEPKMFDRIEQYFKVQQTPEVKFKDLEAVVTSRIVRDEVHFSYRTDFLKVTSDTVLVPVTVQVPNSEMSYENSNGVYSGTLNIFARVSSLTGRVVQTFEDVLRQDIPASLYQQSMKQFSIYQKALPLRPGLYRLDIVVKDVKSGNVGVVNTRLAVPKYDEDTIQASTLILADQLMRAPERQVGSGEFVLGALKVRPRLSQEFSNNDTMGIYMQLYNLRTDEKSHMSNAVIEYQVKQGNSAVLDYKETSADLKQRGEQITIQRLLPLNALAPGKYSIEVRVTDQITKQSISRSSDFTVTAATGVKAAANSPTGG
jgi:GWxTD domain-containing protein